MHYVSGKSLNLLPFEIFNLVKEGILHPFDQYGESIKPPCRDIILDKINALQLRTVPYGGESLDSGRLIEIMDEIAELERKRDEYLNASWKDYCLPYFQQDKDVILESLMNALYSHNDVIKAGLSVKESQTQQDIPPTEKAPAPYSFRRDGAFWKITFAGQESKSIPDVAGMEYIHFLIQHPEESFSCLSLYQIVNGTPAEGKGDAINEGLFSDHKRQEVLTPDVRKELEIRLAMLENADDAGNPENDLIQREEIEKIKRTLAERKFPDNSSNAQNAIRKNLNNAYKKILTDPKMQETVEHFRDHIKTDGKMGRVYSGRINWQTE